MIPGIYFGPDEDHSFIFPGLVEDVQWGTWERQAQYTTQFGLTGATVLDGRRTTRIFTCPMLIYGQTDIIPTLLSLELFILEMEDQEGVVEQFTQVDMNENILRKMPDIEFLTFQRKIHRFDPELGWWVKADLIFRQLNPIPPLEDEDD